MVLEGKLVVVKEKKEKKKELRILMTCILISVGEKNGYQYKNCLLQNVYKYIFWYVSHEIQLYYCCVCVCVCAVVEKYAVADISFVVLYVVGAEKVRKERA